MKYSGICLQGCQPCAFVLKRICSPDEGNLLVLADRWHPLNFVNLSIDELVVAEKRTIFTINCFLGDSACGNPKVRYTSSTINLTQVSIGIEVLGFRLKARTWRLHCWTRRFNDKLRRDIRPRAGRSLGNIPGKITTGRPTLPRLNTWLNGEDVEPSRLRFDVSYRGGPSV